MSAAAGAVVVGRGLCVFGRSVGFGRGARGPDWIVLGFGYRIRHGLGFFFVSFVEFDGRWEHGGSVVQGA